MGRSSFDGEGATLVKYRDSCVVSCAKMAKLIEMAFWLWAWVDSTNHVLDRIQIIPWDGAILRGQGVTHCKVKNSRLPFPRS